MTKDEASAELNKLRSTWQYAYAMGHGCSMEDNTSFARIIREKDKALWAVVSEHK
jgi:hypothetical protein